MSTAPADSTVPPPFAEEGEGHLKRVLGTPSLVLFGLVYMVPLTVFTTYGLVTQMSGGRVPLAYLFLPMLNYLVIGIYMGAALPGVPTWVWILVAIAAVTILNILGIVSVSWANVVIIGLQFVFIAVFVVMSISSISGTGSVNLMAPLAGDGTVDGISPVFTGAALLCLSFLGFDAVSTLSEEAKDAKRTVPKAIMIATVLSGLIYFGLSYISQLDFPSNQFEDVDSGSLDVMLAAGGQFLNVFFTAAYVAGCIGSALTSQASVSRILFAMGRDGILHRKVFGHVSVRFATPTFAILVISVISLAALWIELGFLASIVSFGALVAFSAVNLSVIKHYFFDRSERNVFNNMVLPIIGFALTLWLWTSLPGLALKVGLIWLAIGFVWLLGVTRGFQRPTPVLDMKE